MKYSFRELVIDSRTGLNPRKNFVLGNGGNYYVTIKDIHDGKIVITDKTDRVDDDAITIIKKRSRIKVGDILFTSIGRVGETAIVTNKDDSWDVNESVFVFTLNAEVIIAEYFCLLFQSQSVKDYLMKNSTGSTFKSIKMGQLEKMNFEIPGIEVQKNVVEKVKKLCSIIEERRQQLSELDTLIKARFVEMFESITDTVPLSYYIKILSAGKSLAGEEACQNKVLKTGAVTYDHFDATQVKNLPLDYEPLEDHRVRSGDVIISRMNTIDLVGAAAYVWQVPDHTYLPDRLWRAELYDTSCPIFIWQLLIQNSTKRSIRRIASGTSGSMKNISKSGLLGIPVKKVGLYAQKQFADFVAQVDKSKLLH